MSEFSLTVGELQNQLKNLRPDDTLEFQGGLTFNRIKQRGDGLQVLEFCEPQAYLDPQFSNKNSHVQVVFVKAPEFQEGQIAQEIDINIY